MTVRHVVVLDAGNLRVIELPNGDTIDPADFGLVSGLVGLTDIQTLTNKTLVAARADSLFNGTSPAASLQLLGIASAVNWVELQNNIAGQGPRIIAVGSDANINLILQSKGTGTVQVRYAGVIHEVVGTDLAQTLSNKALIAPSIGDFTAAKHTHQNDAGGGTLTSAAFAVGSGVHRNILCAAVDSAAIANTTTPTAFDNGKVTTTFNAALGAVGATLRLTYSGKFSTTGTPTMTFTLRDTALGTTLLTGPTITTPSGVTNKYWCVQFLVTTRAIGALGSIKSTIQNPVVMDTATAGQVIGNSAAFDFVANGATSTAIGLYATWGTASASNTIVCESAIIEALN